ncbi:acyltransferase [Sphingomonas sp. RB3P16]|uniref:acyltransferase family protein n=1 Tax=Parasphingomonas frigoris TaxID=3096163 RepID=UPI002FCC731C
MTPANPVPTATPAPRHHELRALTSMRGIAAWCVVLFHIRLSLDWLPAPLAALFAKGYLAVDFFFLLSGFVIWLSWSVRLRRGGVRAVPGFLWRRLARIWPLHLVMLGATVALACALAATGRHDAGHYPFLELPLQVLLVQNWGFTTRLTWNDPSWSISTEWAAYLLFPLVAFWFDWRRLPSWAILLVCAALFVLLHALMGGSASLGNDIWIFGLRRCLIEFAVGGAIATVWERWRDAPALPSVGAAAVMIGLLVATRSGVPETLAVPAAFAAGLLLLALTAGRRGNPLEGPALHYFGEISYATYLCHFLLFVVCKLALIDDASAVPPILAALYLALVFGCSVALTHLVERPAQDWMNRLPARMRRAGTRDQASASSS